MSQINEIAVGQVAELNNLIMYRKFVTFVPRIYIDHTTNTITLESHVEVFYNEYVKQNDGCIYGPSYKTKKYLVGNIPATYYVEGDTIPDGKQIGDVKKAAWPAFDGWFTALARTPINANQYGILDSVEATLAGLPVHIPDGYTLQQPG